MSLCRGSIQRHAAAAAEDTDARLTGRSSEPSTATFAFVIEQSLGHRTHGRGLERAAAADPTLTPHFLRLEHGLRSSAVRVPVLRNQSLQGSWQARRAVRRLRRDVKLDALYVHTQTCALLLGDVMGSVPTLISIDATPVNYDSVASGYGHDVHGSKLEQVKRQITRFAFLRAAGVISFSNWAADSVVQDYGVPRSRVHVVRPGVDLTRFRPSPQPLGSRHGALRVLFVGTDFHRKGGAELVDVMRSLDGLAELDVVTGQPIGGAPPNVRVHVGLTHDSAELFELHRRADVFALPSRADCYPLAIVEASASGLPVVATDIGAIPEFVTDGVNGFLVPPSSPHQLAAALRKLSGDPDLRLRMGAEGARRARATHSESNYQRILELMQAAARRAPTGPEA